MDEKGAPGPGGAASGAGDGADARMGMIQINDLVYKLETDLSVAINRTHKTQFFQNQQYTDKQTSIVIINSGADYIDPRRSFLSLDIVIPVTDLLTRKPVDPNLFNERYQNAFISAYFGKNGSVLNLIDSVVVSSRSGDELSRVNDFGQLMSMLLPQMFGQEWRDTVGQEIGFGSFLGGSNNSDYNSSQVPPVLAISEQRRRRFAIPLYLVSPIFNYGRLLPSMLMSGLRIEIKWKPLEVATQQFWEGLPLEWPADGQASPHRGLSLNTQTEFKTFLGASSMSGTSQVISTALFPPATTGWRYTRAAGAGNSDVLDISTGGAWNFNLVDANGFRQFQQGDIIAFSFDTAIPNQQERSELRFTINEVAADGLSLLVQTDYAGPSPINAVPSSRVFGPTGDVIGAWRLSPVRDLQYQKALGGPIFHGAELTPVTPLTSYIINQPEIAMCSIQLTDAIQRTLNEFSSVNGLEIVYADYDRTSTPLQGSNVPIYTEVRKSASRALAAFGRVVRNTSDTYLYDGFASAAGVFWNNFQWQLGSLYFPQQRVESRETIPELRHDGVLAMMYSYTLDAFDRYHPKAAPTMATMRGTGIEYNVLQLHPTETNGGHEPSTYLAPHSDFGKWGSFVNGGTTVATTLERSTLFDLSGIPINNSRVLALRGEVDMSAQAGDYRALLYIFLKYVRLARVFLVNCEVEQ